MKNPNKFTSEGKVGHQTGGAKDIFESKQAGKQIIDLASFLEENPFPVLRISCDGTILYSNPPGQVLLEQWNRGICQKAPKHWCRLIAKALQSKHYLIEEINCSERIFSFALVPLSDKGYVNLYGRDITKQKQTEDALCKSHDDLDLRVKQRTDEMDRTIVTLMKESQQYLSAESSLKESEEKYRSLVEVSPQAICVVVNERIVFANAEVLKLVKAESYEELAERPIWDFIHPDSVKTVRNDIKKLLEEKGKVLLREAKLVCIDGSTVEVEASATSVIHQGKLSVLVTFYDITERKQAQEIIKTERQRMNDVLETLPVYVCILTPGYRMPFANRVFRESFGYFPDKKCYEFLFNRTEPCEICDTFTVLKTHKPHRWEWTGPNGRDYNVFDFPFKDTDGSQVILEMGIDITDRKHAEERIRTTNALLEQFAAKTSSKEYLDSVVEIICDWSGCRCVGIRLTNADGYIPYVSCVGFSEEFLSLESNLCLKEDVCACIRVVAQTPEPQDADVMTERGSFRCDNTFNFVGSLSGNQKKRFRGNCLEAGFASVAVVPVRYRQNILGAIHIADENENKVPLETVKFLEDIAALIGEAVHRFNVEQSLRVNEKRLIEAQRIAHLGNWQWDIARDNLWWSEEVYRIFGIEPEQFKATHDTFLSCLHQEDRGFVKETINQALRGSGKYDIDYKIIRPNGEEKIINEKAEVIYDSNHKPVKMTGTVYDITEQKRAENEIRENQQALRALTAELQLAEERERRRIAQDLHDSIGQILAFSGRELKTLQKTLSHSAAKSIRKIVEQLDIAVNQARTLSFNLSPSTLYDLGFEVAVEDLVDRMTEERKIQYYFKNSDCPKPLTDDIKVLLYRSVRELLINAAKYAEADSVKVSLSRSDSNIHIKVEDDGRGFDTSFLNSDSKRKKGFGIFSIIQSLDHIGGSLKIESAKGKGTKAVLIAPLDVENEE